MLKCSIRRPKFDRRKENISCRAMNLAADVHYCNQVSFTTRRLPITDTLDEFPSIITS
jgi:hypothetical protein